MLMVEGWGNITVRNMLDEEWINAIQQNQADIGLDQNLEASMVSDSECAVLIHAKKKKKKTVLIYVISQVIFRKGDCQTSLRVIILQCL